MIRELRGAAIAGEFRVNRAVDPHQNLAAARLALASGQAKEAIALLEAVLTLTPEHASALNMYGVACLSLGQTKDAVRALRAAVAADPDAASLRLNFSQALEDLGEYAAAFEAIEGALAIDPVIPVALLRKGRLLERLGDVDAGLKVYRSLLQVLPSAGLPPQYDAALAHARTLVERDGRTRRDRLAHLLGDLDELPSLRALTYLDHICGLRAIYTQKPTGPHFPFLPAIEFFDRAQLPWLVELEQACDSIRTEMLALWRDDVDGFAPYIQFDATAPVNQWKELNHSPRWNAFQLWESGKRNDANCARCPATVELIEKLPLLDVPGKGPNVMFSILQPKTHIPPHTGTTNTRATVHLPLIVPEDCFLRVGGDRRKVIEGQAWAFDDTLEHEAWNSSDQPRAILIVDAWNPFLSAVERDVVRLAATEIRL